MIISDSMIIYGKQVVFYAMAHYAHLIEEIYLAKKWDKQSFKQISALKKPIIYLDNKKAQALAKGGNHQGIFAKITPLEACSFTQIKNMQKILIACEITDVGNLGAIFRSAHCLGVQGVIITEIANPKIPAIIRTSAGAIFGVPFCVVQNTLDVINELKMSGFACYGAHMQGDDIAQFEPAQKWALFLGNESEGLKAKILKKLDRMLAIKMYNAFDSLNVSVAAGILMAYLDSNKRG